VREHCLGLLTKALEENIAAAGEGVGRSELVTEAAVAVEYELFCSSKIAQSYKLAHNKKVAGKEVVVVETEEGGREGGGEEGRGREGGEEEKREGGEGEKGEGGELRRDLPLPYITFPAPHPLPPSTSSPPSLALPPSLPPSLPLPHLLFPRFPPSSTSSQIKEVKAMTETQALHTCFTGGSIAPPTNSSIAPPSRDIPLFTGFMKASRLVTSGSLSEEHKSSSCSEVPSPSPPPPSETPSCKTSAEQTGTASCRGSGSFVRASDLLQKERSSEAKPSTTVLLSDGRDRELGEGFVRPSCAMESESSSCRASGDLEGGEEESQRATWCPGGVSFTRASQLLSACKASPKSCDENVVSREGGDEGRGENGSCERRKDLKCKVMAKKSERRPHVNGLDRKAAQVWNS
jgi:hypothetical protein